MVRAIRVRARARVVGRKIACTASGKAREYLGGDPPGRIVPGSSYDLLGTFPFWVPAPEPACRGKRSGVLRLRNPKLFDDGIE